MRNGEPVKERFNKALSEAIDEGLLVLGSSVRDTVYYHVEKISGPAAFLADVCGDLVQRLENAYGNQSNVILYHLYCAVRTAWMDILHTKPF
jgi:hypothetical protein